ncbi:MAG: AI-2E family transporter [Acidobacteriaceae bacterium]
MTTDREYRARQQRRNILFAFAIAVLLYYVYQLRAELTLIYVSALAAVVLQPVAKAIMRIRIGKWHPGIGLSVITLVLAIVALVATFAAFAAPPAFHDLRDFIAEFPTHAPRLLDRIQSLPFMQHVNVDALNAKFQDFATRFATYLFHSAGNWAHALFAIITGILLTVYFMIEGERVYAWSLRLVPIEHRDRLDQTLTRAKLRMGRWLLGQASLMLILGVTSTIVFVILHIRYAYALGVLMGLFNIIPVVGAMITVSLAILVAAIDSWGRVLGVIVFYVIYAQIENSILTPNIMQSRVNLPGVAILVALVIGSGLAGIAGAAVAVPTAVLIAVLINEYLVAGDHSPAPNSSTGSTPAP